MKVCIDVVLSRKSCCFVSIPRIHLLSLEPLLDMLPVLITPFFHSFITVELGVVIGKGGRDISQLNAGSHIAGYSMSVLSIIS
jgi:hypothetical protein